MIDIYNREIIYCKYWDICTFHTCPKILILNNLKIAQAVSEKRTYENYTILYMYIAQEQGQITPRGQNFDYN